MKIQVKATFLNGNQVVRAGQIIEVDEYRARQLIRNGLAAERPPEPLSRPAGVEEEPAPGRKRR